MKASEKYWTGNFECGFTYQWHLYECLREWIKGLQPEKKQNGWEIYNINLKETDFYKKGGLESVKVRYREYQVGCNKYFDLEIKDGNKFINGQEFDWEI